MADVRPFKKKSTKKEPAAKVDISGKAKSGRPSHTLCKSGFHKWKADTTTDFAVKEGRLFTRYQCERCNKTKIEWR